MWWIAAFFLACFGAAMIKPEGKARAELTIGGFIFGGILCALGLTCSVVDTIQDGGPASWIMLIIVVLMTSLAVVFRILAIWKRP